MRLLLIDLDNTLIDRDAAFATWIREEVERQGGTESDVQALIEADDSGYSERDEFAKTLRERLGTEDDLDKLIDRIRHEHVEHVELNEGVRERLERFGAAGVEVGVLTNGNVKQQTMKLERVGLEHLVDGAVISESAGLEKPDPEIFRRAMSDRGAEPGETWMVGDNADADICGAQKAGIRTGWVSLGREWPGGERATVEAETTSEVLDLIGFD
jgi:HAD superfamily hydrolase (TIGR01549 family)